MYSVYLLEYEESRGYRIQPAEAQADRFQDRIAIRGGECRI